MDSNQQFVLQMTTIIVGMIVTVVGLVIAARKAGQAVVQGVAATNAAQTAVAVAATTSQKADVLIEKTAEIHVLANNTLSKTTAALEVALEKIAGLERIIVSTAPALALAQAPAPTPAPASIAVQTVKADEDAPLAVKIVATVPVPVETEGARAPQVERRRKQTP